MPNELPPRRKPWALDNGAFRAWRAGKEPDFAQFEQALGQAGDADFVVAPDLPAAGEASLALSLSWASKIHQKAYLAAQDGMSLAAIEAALPHFAGLFVGGTLFWKLKHGPALVELAHRLGKPCHIGRCGTARRIRWAHAIGADSIDSSLPLWSEGQLSRAVDAVDTADRQLYLW